MSRNNRSDAEYEIAGATKCFKVEEALEGKPVKIQTVMERTEFSYDLTTRCLKTLRLNGRAIQLDDGRWTIGRRLIRFAASITRQQG